MEGKIVDNKYIIGEQIGKGGFSKVYKAYLLSALRSGVGKDLVDKLLSSSSQPDLLKNTLESQDCDHVIKVANCPDYDFKNEALISQNINGKKGVVKSVEFGECNKNAETGEAYDYIVSKLIKGGQLFDYVTPTGMSEDRIRKILLPLAQALDLIHKSGYAHMDVKLSNILLDKSGSPHIADYGLAVRALSDDLLDGSKYCFSGSRKYTAPEILQKKMFSPLKADIFSLGVCLFIMTVGCYPFKQANQEDRKFKRLYNQNPMSFWYRHPRAKKRLNEGSISLELADLIVKMLLPDPTKRISLTEILNHPWVNKTTF